MLVNESSSFWQPFVISLPSLVTGLPWSFSSWLQKPSTNLAHDVLQGRLCAWFPGGCLCYRGVVALDCGDQTSRVGLGAARWVDAVLVLFLLAEGSEPRCLSLLMKSSRGLFVHGFRAVAWVREAWSHWTLETRHPGWALGQPNGWMQFWSFSSWVRVQNPSTCPS